MSKFQNSVKAFLGRNIIYFLSTWLFKHHRKCLIDFGDRRHHVECDLHVRMPTARRSVWPPTPAEISICILWKREINLSDSVSARLCSACPRRHPIPRFRSIPGDCTCTQSRATWPQDTPKFQAGWAWGGNNSATSWREGPLYIRRVWSLAPAQFWRGRGANWPHFTCFGHVRSDMVPRVGSKKWRRRVRMHPWLCPEC